MDRWKTLLWTSLAALAVAAVVGSLGPAAMAQVRAALVRDADNPALQPFRANADFSLTAINEQRLLVTVPAGKRLVIEHVSYYAYTQPGIQFVFAGLRSPQFGTFWQSIQINPPHASADSGFVIQDGSQPVRLYFEPGEEVWVSASTSAGGIRQFNIHISGYYVTL